MDHLTASILGEVAYLRRTAELLIDRLKDLDGLIAGDEDLTATQEGMVASANQHQASRAREHLQLAEQYVDEWRHELEAALRSGVNHLG